MARDVGIYWDHETWELARAAYIAGLDADRDPALTWTAWLNRVVQQHAARTSGERAALAEHDDVQPYERPRGFQRRHRLDDEVLEAMDAACAADRRTRHRIVSRSWFTREAVLAALPKPVASRGSDAGTVPAAT